MLIVGGVAILLVIIVLVKLFAKKSFGEKEGNVEYVKKGDTGAQIIYEDVKNPKKPYLSPQDLIELSWKFLYDITEVIINKFTPTAKKEVHECGKELVNSGVKYQHSVEYTPTITASYPKNMEEGKDSSEVQR